jgi:diketogulonate reductase-like aldo/keto reductase
MIPNCAASQNATVRNLLKLRLPWVIRQDGMLAIPKAGDQAHVRENHGALEVRLTKQDLAELDRAFPPPSGPQALEML